MKNKNPFREEIKKVLDDIESGKITKYIFGYEKADSSGRIVITSHDLRGLKSTIRNAITEPRK